MRKVLALTLGLAVALALAPAASAQLAKGNIYGSVADNSGAVLPGANVALTGPAIGNLSTISSSQGDFRFLGLDPGTYRVSVTLAGFTKVEREVIVNTGANVNVPFVLKLASVEETITVEATSPVIDSKKTGTATNFSQDELSKVPNSRDPWALLRSVPGIIMDRVNIAGNESGQQSNFVGKGANRSDSVWSLDGVNITDMAAVGASPTYFDYDAFEEITISTGSADIRQPTGGIGLNFVTKRGTNSFRGTLRGYFTHEDLGWSNVPDELARTGVTAETANHNKQISDYGFDLGGPIVKDKLWFWGSWGKQDIRLVRSAGNLIDKTLLIDYNGKLNWQASSKDSVNVMWFRGAKQKFGRGTGACAGCVEPDTATWNQDDNYPEGKPPGLWKAEWSRVFNPDLFLTLKYSYYGTGFQLVSRGPMDQQAGISQRQGKTFGSTRSLFFERPQTAVSADGSWFRTGMGGVHEIKYGFSWRQNDALSQTLWPGNMVVAFDNSATDKRARVYREGRGTDRNEFLSFYLGDTFTRDRVTLNLGLRFDRQTGKALPSDTQSNKAFPNLVPGIKFPGYDAPFEWSDITPRVGLTYALDEQRKTLVRASYSRYASQLYAGIVGYMNPSSAVGFADYPWTDLNGDNFAQPNEVNTGVAPITFGGGFNPAAPTAVASANRIDPNLEAPLADEVIVGVDREVASNFAVSVSYTYRRNTRDIAELRPNMTLADYAAGTPLTGTLPSGQSYNIPTFIPNADKVRAAGGGRFLTNRDGYHQAFSGFELAATKRLSNKWMMRLAASYNDWTEGFDGTPQPYNGNPTRVDTDPLVSGGQTAPRSAGSGAGDVFVNGKWSININGMYQLPWDLEVAANLFGRQGAPNPPFRVAALGLDGSQRVLLTSEIDTLRLDDIWNLDLRLAKNVKAGRTSMVITADLFNVLNSNVELNRFRNAASANYLLLTDNLSPRILRLGLRLNF